MQSLKKITCLSAVIVMLISSQISKASNTAAITITGRVLANSCTVDTASAVQNVSLPDIGDRSLTAKGQTGGEKTIIVNLRNCGVSTGSVIVTASGGTDANDPAAFANTAAGGATGVGLYFYQTDGKTLFSPDGSVNETSSLEPSVDNVLRFKAAYVSTLANVGAGGFSTVVNLRFDYQ